MENDIAAAACTTNCEEAHYQENLFMERKRTVLWMGHRSHVLYLLLSSHLPYSGYLSRAKNDHDKMTPS